jgi:gliding motility-associated-like protein
MTGRQPLHFPAGIARTFAASLILMLPAPAVFAQLTVNSQTDLQALAHDITGPGVVISNPQVDCDPLGYGEFQYSGTLLGMDGGVLLTTGKAVNAIGPNNAANTSFEQGTSGNSTLNIVTGRTTKDACAFEFDVIPTGDSLHFDFVFGSEEYNEWVGSQYNDVFGFFISGPGITGDPGIGNDKNIALLPGTNEAVAINSVNNAINPVFFHDNTGGLQLQYDGLTTGLSARSAVQPCATYHLKLIVADASDRTYDSGVFIAKVKSNAVTMMPTTLNGGTGLVEGCNSGYVRFTRAEVTDQPLTLDYYLQGTATNGSDYTAIGDPDPAAAKTITVPANAAYVDQPIDPLADGIAEGTETLIFILGDPNCPGSILDSLTLDLTDSLSASVSPASSVICQGGQVQLTASGGTHYQWSPATGLNSDTVADPTAQPGTTTTYSVIVQNGACTRTLNTLVKVSGLSLSAVITQPLCNGAGNGAVNLSVVGGFAPYTYAWSGPNSFSATTQDITNIPTGTYTVTVTDAGCSRTQSFNVDQPATLTASLSPSLLVYGQNISCHGGSDGSIHATITGGTGPYTAAWTGPGGFTSNSIDIAGLSAGTYTLTVTDASGCSTVASTVMTDTAPLVASIGPVTGVACANAANGSATVTVSGGVPGYAYAWNTSPVQTEATANGLAPGTYTVTTTDLYGCSTSTSATIPGPLDPLTATMVSSTDAGCFGSMAGSATVVVSGGTAPYNYAWSTVPVQTGATASGLGGGGYTVTVTDANGCGTIASAQIGSATQPLAIAITAQQDAGCNGTAGSASVVASGGSGPYDYAWNTTPVHHGASISNLSAGSYHVTATDVHGCSAGMDVVIGGASGLNVGISATSGPPCSGSANGSATALASGGTGPYAYSWNTTPTQATATASGLESGNWTVTVIDANGCNASATAAITAPSAIAITGTVVPAPCPGGAVGSVDVSTSGGTSPYTWSWSGPGGFTSSSEDIASLNAGGYVVNVTDGNGCSAAQAFDVNTPGLFSVSTTPLMHGPANVSCQGSSDGAIDLSVSGAAPPYSYAWAGPGGSTFASEDISGLTAGEYAVTITDVNGCSTSTNVTLSAPTAMSIQLVPSDHNGAAISCHGGSNGTISTWITGGNAPYSTSWTGPSGFTSSLSDLTGLAAGTYTVTITDANNCTATQSITLDEPTALAAASVGVVPESCYGSTTGGATVDVSGGTSPYSYAWSTVPVQHNATATGLSAGSYTVSISDANGCVNTAPVSVGGPVSPLTVNAVSVGDNLCNGGNDGSATVQATGGTAPYSYVWNTDPPVNGATANGLAAGIRAVTVTDAHGCSISLNVAVHEPAQPLSANLTDLHNVLCYGDQNGTATVLASGGSGNYSITWNTIPVQTGATATNLAPGTYTAQVADANGCTQTVNVTVSIQGPTAPLSLTYLLGSYPGGGGLSCKSASDGSIDLSVSGGTPNYVYFWTDGQGGEMHTQDLTGLSAGYYHITVEDGNHCEADTMIAIDAPPPIIATASINTAICNGSSNGAIDLSVSGGAGPYTYQWSGPNGFSATTQDLTSLAAGAYLVAITDANGCGTMQAFDITEAGGFSLNADVLTYPGENNTSCSNSEDGAIDLSATGGTEPYQFTWTGPGGSTANTADITGLGAGTYFVVLTDANGCSALGSYTLTSPTLLNVFTISHKTAGGFDISCGNGADGSIDATTSGGTPPYSYSWTGPNGFTASTADISGLGAGTYVLTVTDANGCSVTASNDLYAPDPIIAPMALSSFADGSNISCNGTDNGSITISPGGGTSPFNVAWSGPGGFTSDDWQITGLEPGAYSALVTDINGCSVIVDTALTAPAAITLSATATDAACHDGASGSIAVSVSGGAGGYHYQWSGPGTFTDTTEDVGGLFAGSYAVTVTDMNGCTASTDAAIDQPSAIAADAIIVTADCQAGNTGSIDLTVSGGTPGYTYLWSGYPAFSATTEDISSLFAGAYSVAVTDANGCTLDQIYNVSDPGLFDITAELSSYGGGYNVSCADASNGSIDISVSGGAPGYTYLWTGPNGFTSIDADITGLAPGEYILTVHDANGCNSSASFTLTAPPPIAIGLAAATYPGGGNTGCDGSSDGSINATISGGIGPYAVSWTGPDGALGINEDLAGLAAGTYTILVTDALGCTATSSITLVGPPPIVALATAHVYPNGDNLSCADSNDGSISLSLSGGHAPYAVAWSGPNNFIGSGISLSGLAQGLYIAVVSDANGCSTSVQITLVAPTPIAVDIATSQYSGGTQVSCSGAMDGTITATVSGGSPGYQLNWTGPGGFTSTSASLTDLAPGTYSLTVTDLTACSTTIPVVLAAPPAITVSALLSDFNGAQVSCSGNDGSIDLTVGGGQPGYQFDWTGPDGAASQAEDLTGLAAGTYAVIITDANGCSTERTYSLQAPQQPTLTFAVTGNACDASDNGAIDLTISNGTSPYVIQWTGPNGFTSTDEDISGLGTGTYTATVTGATGCPATASVDVTAPSPIGLELSIPSYGTVNIPCKGDSSGAIALNILGGSAPFTITWSGPNGFTSDSSAINGLLAGTYSVHVQDDHGCTQDSSITLVEPATAVNAVLTAAFYPSGTNIACFGNSDGSINATVMGGNGPYSYDWRGPDSTSFSTGDLSGIPAGEYQLVVTDSNQCATTVLITLTQPDTALYSTFSVTDHNGFGTSCASTADGAIDLAILGGSPDYTLGWSGPNGFTSTEDSISGLPAGSYLITATDVNGCVLSDTMLITAPPPIVPNITVATFPSGTNISCAGMDDGAISATVSGGAPVLTLLWSGPNGFTSSATAIDSLAPGSYCLHVADANGCTADSCTVLVTPDTLQVMTTPTPASCGNANGAVQTTISGGGSPYSASWSSGQQSADLNDLSQGSYMITVTDANGCTDTSTAIIAGTPGVMATGVVSDPLCHDSDEGAIDLTVTAGASPFDYLWNGTGTDEDLDSLAAGSYAISVTDANGCTWDSTFSVTAPATIGADTSLSIYADGNNISTYGGDDGSIDVAPSGGTPPYTYLWNTGATSASLHGLIAGLYTVTITDAHGCTLTLNITLTQPEVLEMPSGFTPNGDGNNDHFVIHGIDGYPNNQFTVLNRWGNVVYDQPHYHDQWQGDNREGKKLPDGTYFVILKLGNGKTLQHYVDLRR